MAGNGYLMGIIEQSNAHAQKKKANGLPQRIYDSGIDTTDMTITEIAEVFGVLRSTARSAMNRLKKRYGYTWIRGGEYTHRLKYRDAPPGVCRNCGGKAYPNIFFCPDCHGRLWRHEGWAEGLGDIGL